MFVLWQIFCHDFALTTNSARISWSAVAAGTPTGRVLRVKGRGIKKGAVVGDLLVTVEVQVPRRVEGKAEEAIKAFAAATADHDIRAEFVVKAKS